MGGVAGEGVRHGFGPAVERPVPRAQRGARRLPPLGGNEVGDRLRLRQVELAVQKGAPGKLPRERGSRARRNAGAQKTVDEVDAAVDGDLDDLLPREAPRRAKEGDDRFVDLPIRVARPPIGAGIPFHPGHGLFPGQPDHAVRDRRGLGAGQAHHADPAGPQRRRDRRDRIHALHPVSSRPAAVMKMVGTCKRGGFT